MALGVLALGLGGTGLTAGLASEAEQRLVQSRFERAAEQATADINQQLRSCGNIILSGVGLANASADVTRAEWRTFVTAVQLQSNLTVLRGLAYVTVVRPGQFDAFVAAQRDGGYPQFTLHCEQPSEAVNTIVTYLEPLAGNEQAIGFNSWSNPVTRDTMIRAVESGAPAVSGPVWLVQAPKDRLDAVVYAPVFRAGAPTTTIEERWAALDGFIAAPMDLTEAVQAAAVSMQDGMRAELQTRDSDGRPVIMAAVGAAENIRLSKVTSLDGIGRTWQLNVVADSNFVRATSSGRTVLVALFGSCASLLAAGLAWSLVTTRHRAQMIADSSVAMLRQSTDQLRSAKDELETKADELELARAAAESASEAKSEFLANMSHEIRTPITALIGFADLLSEPGLNDADRLSHIATIQNSGRHLLAIVNNVLDLSKIEAGRMAIESLPTDIRRIIREVTDMFAAQAGAKGLSLGATVDPGVPARVVSDPTRLRQILVNLVGNALKFTESGGVTVSVAYQNGGLTVAVRDTGVGLTAEQTARLFQSFSQADASMSRRFGGTGLGLVISRKLCELLGGSLSVQSTHGAGSCFTAAVLAAPGEPPAPTPPATDAASADTTAGRRILIVEDGPDNQRLLRFILQKHGLRCVTAENGQVALEAVGAAEQESDPFDLILMDMQMPVMDGYTATAELRRRGCRLPIIALTAHAMSDDRRRCLDAGCDDYATKPFDRARLIEIITEHTRMSDVPDRPMGVGGS